jgi:hypothetical protein
MLPKRAYKRGCDDPPPLSGVIGLGFGLTRRKRLARKKAIILLMTSCTKQISPVNSEQETQSAINEIRKIIGSEGVISVETKSLDDSINYQMISMGLQGNGIRNLSIVEFKELFLALKDSIKLIRLLNTKEVSNYKSLSDDDPIRPGRSGAHAQSFYTPYFFSGSSPRSILTTLNLNYNTDLYGRVIGQPNIYFTGISVFSWVQTTPNPLINFNSNTLTSSFIISGTTFYGISIGGLNLGVTLGSSYLITIHMDNRFGQDGWVDIRFYNETKK